MKNADKVVVIKGKEYSFEQIQLRSKHAPVVELEVEKLKYCTPTGDAEVDSSDLRICKLNNTYVVLSGFDKVTAASTAPVDAAQLIKVSAKLMSETYLSAALIPPASPKEKSLAEKFASVGYKVRPDRKTSK